MEYNNTQKDVCQMKIKFSKVVAIGCALCVAFAGLTAFAATVTTKTTYDHSEEVTTIEVDTEVNGVAPGSEVTYYVSDGTNIVYINQDTATNGSVTFKFNANKGAVLAATAKYGTDDANTTNLPTFAFNEGTNFITNAPAKAEAVDGAWGVEVPAEVEGVSAKAVAYKAVVSGNYLEYGITVDGVNYPAAGCDDDGTYMVILDNIKATTVVPYVISAN